LSSIIVGIVTGSWFGNLLTAKEFPTYKLGLAPLVLHLQKLDPLGKNMLLFLGIALAIGFIQLCWGLAIKLFFHLSNRSYKDAMFDSFPPLLFVSGLVVLFFNRKTGMIISGISLIVILFFAGRQYKNPIVRIGMGVWTIYGTVTGFLSDVLSYSRLFALGLASGIMASVTNILAFIISSIIPIPLVNWIICIIFLVIAHTLNLAINVLGAFIHTTRLQFVEFFQKFYINGGRRFEPLSVKERFITFSDNHDK
jgi:V/A-type H+-transporting ATPase subunit I